MQRLLGCSGLRVKTAQKWEEITPKIISQAELEAVSNRGLKDTLDKLNFGDKGI